uniref:Tail protein n=1 Tax=viral metagenome TaxID=1070528 RepID=A0A6M3JR13_9ZZZZ
MSWTAPRTWTAGEIVTAAIMNSAVRDDLRFIKGLDGTVVLEDGLNLGANELTINSLETVGVDGIVNKEQMEDHTHADADNCGTVAHSALTGLTTGDDHTQYQKESLLTTQGDMPYATGASAWARLAKGGALQYLRMNAGDTAPEWATAPSDSIAMYGDGNDGNVTISVNTNLSRDMYYNNLTIDSTKILSTKGYRIFVAGALDNNGTIEHNGASTANGTGGAGAVTGTMSGGGDGGNSNGGGGGGGGGGGLIFIASRTIDNTGGVIQANGGNGSDGISIAEGQSGTGSAGGSVSPSAEGGAGGAGGQGNGTAGGAGGTTTTTYGVRSALQELVSKTIGGGAGGGGGSCNQTIGAGGGGGGGGGAIIIIYDTVTAWATEECAGGSGGAFLTDGTNGTAGTAGTVIKIANI